MPGTAFPEGQEPDDVTAGDSTVDAIRHELESLLGTEPVANSQRGWQSGGGATGSVPFGATPNTSYTDKEFQETRAEFEQYIAKHGTGPGPVINPGARVQKWADRAMWQAPEHVDPQKPKVTVSMCTPDPLGMMAMVNAQYTGRNLTDPLQVTDEERRDAWHAATVSKLSETPLEWIQWSINFENVSRAFTHQLVRTRMATYAQESQRFAVKDNVHDAVKLPPELEGTLSYEEFVERCAEEGVDPRINASQAQAWRNEWDNALAVVGAAYGRLVDSGFPAESARGILPTNMLTRVHMRVDMKTLLHLAGMRLCTQAQFEWRAVFAELARAIREYGRVSGADGEAWQYELIANSFRPICFMEDKCTMKAKSDRFCAIRAQVDEFEEAGIKSNRWEEDGIKVGLKTLDGIKPYQWLADPTAARKAPGQE